MSTEQKLQAEAEAKQLSESIKHLTTLGVDMKDPPMSEKQIIHLSKIYNNIVEENTVEAHTASMVEYKKELIAVLKPLVLDLASSAHETGLVDSEIGIESCWSKGGSIELDTKEKITFDVKFVNPKADTTASTERKKVEKTFVEKQKKMLEGLGLKDLAKYLRFKVQEKSSFKSGIFSENLIVGDYEVQYNLGLTKYTPKED